MATNSECFSHGEHNEAACSMLNLTQQFPDWTVTTAFYASLHFVSSKIFPFTHKPGGTGKDLVINDIEDWQRFKSYTSNKRHELIKDLVGAHCSQIYSEYDWLLSLSMTSRYHHYTFPPEVVNRAISYMRKIKQHCIPSQSAKKK